MSGWKKNWKIISQWDTKRRIQPQLQYILFQQGMTGISLFLSASLSFQIKQSWNDNYLDKHFFRKSCICTASSHSASQIPFVGYFSRGCFQLLGFFSCFPTPSVSPNYYSVPIKYFCCGCNLGMRHVSVYPVCTCKYVNDSDSLITCCLYAAFTTSWSEETSTFFAISELS